MFTPASPAQRAKLPSPIKKKRGDDQERRCSHRHRPHSGRNSHRQSARSAGTAWNANLRPCALVPPVRWTPARVRSWLSGATLWSPPASRGRSRPLVDRADRTAEVRLKRSENQKFGDVVQRTQGQAKGRVEALRGLGRVAHETVLALIGETKGLAEVHRRWPK